MILDVFEHLGESFVVQIVFHIDHLNHRIVELNRLNAEISISSMLLHALHSISVKS